MDSKEEMPLTDEHGNRDAHTNGPSPAPSDVEQRLAQHDPQLVFDLARIIDLGDTSDVRALGEALWAIEVLRIEDQGLRERLRVGLFTLAIALRDDRRASTRPLIYSALRRYATLVDERNVDSLLAFLTEADDAATRQCALQCVQTVFFRSPPTLPHDALIQRIGELVERYLHPDVLVDPAMRSLAANAAVALSVASPATAEDVARRIHSLRRPGLRALVASKWSEMLGTFEHHAARLAEHEQNRETCKEHGHVPDMASTFRSGNNLNCHHCKRCGEVVEGK